MNPNAPVGSAPAGGTAGEPGGLNGQTAPAPAHAAPLRGARLPANTPAPVLKKAAVPPLNAIAAVVDGSVISQEDVHNRIRLFALSTGMHLAPEMAERLAPQITRELIDEKLQLQEMQRRKIVVSDAEIAHAIAGIEQRNNMPAGALRASLGGQGVAMRTLIDQLRVQLGWVRVIREVLGAAVEATDNDVADRIARLKAETGQVEYRVGEIFIPVDQPTQDADAHRFAEAVISQLRNGAPFTIVAAQFSSGQNALQGGDLGWVQPRQLDPAVAELLKEMPVGAISNPVKVAGGYDVVTLRAKREVGHDSSTVVHIRQVFLPFPTTLNADHPTPQQEVILAKAQSISNTAKTCDDIEAANKAAGSPRTADPGEVRLEDMTQPQLRTILSSQPIGKPTGPLVAPDGIVVMMVCSRDVVSDAAPPRQQLVEQIINERAELASRQLIDDLRRRALIERRSS
jgi:peptidyl-prolyl cis-trans isomerase SurA